MDDNWRNVAKSYKETDLSASLKHNISHDTDIDGQNR